jgi:hypothetical protein
VVHHARKFTTFAAALSWLIRAVIAARSCQSNASREPLSDHITERFHSMKRAIRHLAIIERESLLIKVPEYMERLYGDVRALEITFQARPEVLDPVRMNIALNVGSA